MMATNTVGFAGSLLKPVSITSGPTVSVSKFGAVGDGKKDDTAAIQSALNYVKTHGGTLNFEAGKTYIVSERLKIVGADDFKIDGNDATIKMANGVPVKSGYSILFIEESNHFAVADLNVDGNRANRSPAEVPAHNIHIKGSQDFSFTEVDSLNAVADGFYLQASNPADPSTYTKNGLFLDSRADNGFRQGMSIINGDNILVIGGAYTNTRGTKPAAGIDVEANRGTAVPGNHDILIKGVTFAGNDGYGVQLTARGKPTNITIEDSRFTDNDRGGVKVGTASTLIKGNTFENFSESERGIVDLPAAGTNSNNVIAGNSFNNINTGEPVIFAHHASGANNEVYDNKFFKIDGPTLDLNASGVTERDNVRTNGPTSPASSPTPVAGLASADGDATVAPAGDGVVSGTTGNDQLATTNEAEIVQGDDTFVFTPGFGKQTITGFEAGAGTGDVIEFDRSVFADVESVLAHATQSGSDVVIAADEANAVTLKNVAVSNLHADDFRFV